MTLEIDRIYCGDCLELMQRIPDRSIDAIITDPPYGTTRNRWDIQIPLRAMWEEFNRIVEDHAPMVIFGLPPFSSQLIVSNPKQYRYTWIWDKRLPVGFLNANRAPLRRYEAISVFSRRAAAYYPQMTEGEPYYRPFRSTTGRNYGDCRPIPTSNTGSRYPTDIIDQWHNAARRNKIHPTQKPVPLFEYLVRTYTQPSQAVLDPFIGSGTTGMACISTGRRFIGIEKNPEYYEMACARIRDAQEQTRISSLSGQLPPANAGGLQRGSHGDHDDAI